ncbi:MAG: HipA N-terminal domain-containing protein [Bacteroidota bacterium]|nr:HipA N-terminal domain-containing protein [Bacteroidota bacterium]
MREARILFKEEEAGILIQENDGTFTFRYKDNWMADSEKQGICLTLPKTQQEYYSKYLFPFFYNMLPEGANKQVVCKHLRIEPDDYFGLLLTIAKTDTIGAVRVIKIEQ